MGFWVKGGGGREQSATPTSPQSGKVVAVMEILNKLNGEPFNEADVRMMEAVARTAGTAFQNAMVRGGRRECSPSLGERPSRRDAQGAKDLNRRRDQERALLKIASLRSAPANGSTAEVRQSLASG